MSKKILVADDDPVVTRTLRAILENAGYQVVEAADGQECAMKFLLDAPDLILLDIMMPKMDGYSFLIAMKELKEMNAHLPDAPVIVITGRLDEQTKELVGKENIRDYILKPFDNIEGLLQKIRNALP